MSKLCGESVKSELRDLPRELANSRCANSPANLRRIKHIVRCGNGLQIFNERLKCGTAGFRRPERSELAALTAVATTDLFAFL
jgi:hypothetical protein